MGQILAEQIAEPEHASECVQLDRASSLEPTSLEDKRIELDVEPTRHGRQLVRESGVECRRLRSPPRAKCAARPRTMARAPRHGPPRRPRARESRAAQRSICPRSRGWVCRWAERHQAGVTSAIRRYPSSGAAAEASEFGRKSNGSSRSIPSSLAPFYLESCAVVDRRPQTAGADRLPSACIVRDASPSKLPLAKTGARCRCGLQDRAEGLPAGNPRRFEDRLDAVVVVP
jgi:hypothetical protein